MILVKLDVMDSTIKVCKIPINTGTNNYRKRTFVTNIPNSIKCCLSRECIVNITIGMQPSKTCISLKLNRTWLTIITSKKITQINSACQSDISCLNTSLEITEMIVIKRGKTLNLKSKYRCNLLTNLQTNNGIHWKYRVKIKRCRSTGRNSNISIVEYLTRLHSCLCVYTNDGHKCHQQTKNKLSHNSFTNFKSSSFYFKVLQIY